MADDRAGFENLPDGYALVGVEPDSVEVTFKGVRRELVLEDMDDVRVHVDALLVELGRRTFQVLPEAIDHPEALDVVDVEPKQIRVSVRKQGE